MACNSMYADDETKSSFFSAESQRANIQLDASPTRNNIERLFCRLCIDARARWAVGRTFWRQIGDCVRIAVVIACITINTVGGALWWTCRFDCATIYARPEPGRFLSIAQCNRVGVGAAQRTCTHHIVHLLWFARMTITI